MITSRKIRGGGLWTGIKRFNLTHFQFNNQPFIPTHKFYPTNNIFHPIVIGWNFIMILFEILFDQLILRVAGRKWAWHCQRKSVQRPGFFVQSQHLPAKRKRFQQFGPEKCAFRGSVPSYKNLFYEKKTRNSLYELWGFYRPPTPTVGALLVRLCVFSKGWLLMKSRVKSLIGRGRRTTKSKKNITRIDYSEKMFVYAQGQNHFGLMQCDDYNVRAFLKI